MAVRSVEQAESPAIKHLGYSVERYDIEWLLEELAGLGIEQIDPPSLTEPGMTNANKSWVREREGTPELYFADGRGVIVQLCDQSYCGGSGVNGEVCENQAESPTPGIFALSEINHFTAFVNDGAGANLWYQESFGLEVQAYQGPGSPVTGIGDGYQFVMYAGPFGPGGADTPANLHHGCFNMTGFDEEGILAKMTEYGISDQGDRQIGPMMHYVSRRMPERGGAEGGTPELYFTDPDGILMQLQDITYCGGGGYLGSECIRD
jgi:catechol 2,3-dioxygenase-like lactoylglutathione lyase family enzyme